MNRILDINEEVIKMRETDTHVYFVAGPFSNWYPSDFSVGVGPDNTMMIFDCEERHMMVFDYNF